MNRSIHLVLVAFALVAGPSLVKAQSCTDSLGFTGYFADGLNTAWNLGCYYLTDSQAGIAGCEAYGQCNNGDVLDVSFVQRWACSTGGHVMAQGNNSLQTEPGYCPISGEFEFFNNGVQASGIAYVHPSQGAVLFFGGWESASCEELYNFSGPFAYDC
jgi:hypothetical protein